MFFMSQLRAKGQFGPSMHSTSVVKTEQAHPFSQQSHPVVVPENFGSVATDEALAVEDEGSPPHFCIFFSESCLSDSQFLLLT